MKKLFAMLLALCIIVSLAACAGGDTTQSEDPTQGENAPQGVDKTYTVAYDNTMDPAVYEAVPAYQFNASNMSWMIPNGMTLKVELALVSDGTYTLTSQWANIDPNAVAGDPGYMDIHVVAQGTYTIEGDKVTISAATSATAAFDGGAYITEQSMFDVFSFAAEGKGTGEWNSADVPEILDCVPATVFTVTEDGAIVTWEPVDPAKAGNPHDGASEPETEATEPETEAVEPTGNALVMLSPEWDAVAITFNADGTYKFELSAYGITEEGTWTYADGVLTVTKPSGNTIASTVEGDVMSLDYVADASEQLVGQFESTDWSGFFGGEAPAGNGLVVTSPAWDQVLLTLNEDGTYKFELAAYGITEEGTWTYADGVLTVTKPSGNTVASVMEGEDMKLDYVSDASEQLVGQFVIPAADLSFFG